MNIPIREYWQLLNRYLVKQRGATLLMALLILGSNGLGLVTPQIVRTFIDSALAGAPVPLLTRMAIRYFIFQVASHGLSIIARYRVRQVALTATNALRIDLTAHLMRLDLGFHKMHPPGELVERIDSDVGALSSFLSNFIIDLLGSILQMTGILIILMIEDIVLGALMSVFALLALILLVWVRRFAPPHWKADRECSGNFWGSIGEVLTATEDIRACGAVQYAMQRFIKLLQGWRPVMLRAQLWGSIWMVAEVAFITGTALYWGVGGSLVLSGKLSLGTIYMIGTYLRMLVWWSISDIQGQLTDLQHAQASIVRVQELFNTTSALVDGTTLLPPGALSIAFKNVNFAYQDTLEGMGLPDDPPSPKPSSNLVLQNLSFQLGAGRVLGLLGRTGSGKTTIARLLFRWYDPQEGEIRLGDIDLQQTRIDALRARVGLVTQDVQLFQASLRDNLTFFDPTIPDVRLVNTLQTLGLTTWLTRLPQGLDSPVSNEVLSAGEAQLIALARVYLKDPDLVILDEASSRLDPVTERYMGQALDRLLRGRTAVVIAHRLKTVDRADEILILEGGQVMEKGSRSKLVADPDSYFYRLLQTGIEKVLT